MIINTGADIKHRNISVKIEPTVILVIFQNGKDTSEVLKIIAKPS